MRLIIADGFTIWDTKGVADANVHLQLQSPDGRRVVVPGRPDYLICDGDSTVGTYLNKTRRIVEIESKDDEELCQLQMMAHLYTFMNKLGLENFSYRRTASFEHTGLPVFRPI